VDEAYNLATRESGSPGFVAEPTVQTSTPGSKSGGASTFTQQFRTSSPPLPLNSAPHNQTFTNGKFFARHRSGDAGSPDARLVAGTSCSERTTLLNTRAVLSFATTASLR
jgi:hypothetical protein